MSHDPAPEDGSGRRFARRAGWMVGVVVAVVGVSTVLAASTVVGDWRLDSLQAQTDAVARGLERGLGEAMLKVELVDGFFQGSAEVGPDEFERFARSLDLGQGSDSVMVALQVDAADMVSFTETLSRWYPGAELFEVDGGARVALRPHRGARYIVTFHAPPEHRPSVVGYDFTSEETRREAAGRALETGDTVISGFVGLVGSEGDDGFLAVSQVRDPSGEQIGVAAAATDSSSMLGKWVPASLRAGLEFWVLEGPASPTAVESGPFEPVVLSEVEVPGSGWTVVARMADSGDWLAWVTGAGLVVAVLFASVTGYLVSHRLHRRSLQARLRWAHLLANERDRTIEALSDFELLAENATDMIARLDLELTYRYVSPAIQTLLGFPPDLPIGRQPWDSFHPDDVAAVRGAVDQVVAGADLSDVEHRARHADGRWVWLHTTARAIRDGSGRVVEIQTSSRDITERVAQREALHEAQRKTERAAAEKAKFLSTVSHEIRTPLNAVAGMSELLSTTHLDDAQREYVETITAAARSVVSLVGDLLDLSRAELGRLRIEAIPFDLPSTVAEVVRLLSSQAQVRGVALREEIGPGVPELVVGDPHRIRQVMVNLVGNALNFTDDGSVTVRVSSPPAGVEERRRVRIEVEDTGIGIPPERLDSVFEEYEQADDSISRRFGGSGLGLGISRQLVGLMGGQLAARSTHGEGSTFWFELELATAGREKEAPSGCLVVGLPHERAAVVRALSAEGWEVSESDRVDSAPTEVPLVVAGPIAGATTHGLTGAIVVDTAPRRGNARRVETAGASAYLGSPFTPGELSRLIRRTGDDSSFVTRHDLGEPSPALRILAADDAPSNRLLVERMLSRRGHSVVSVADGAEALAAFAADVFDVVLLDGEMPVMSGTDATREIRRLDALSGQHTPIVALTGRVSDAERGEAIAAGADLWVPKPFDSNRLYQVVEQAAGVTRVQSTERPSSVLDRDVFEAQVGGMPELAEELAMSVGAEWAELAGDLGPDQVAADHVAAGMAAHRLRGVLAMVGATMAADLAGQVESAANDGDVEAAKAAAGRLESMRPQVESALNDAVAASSRPVAHPNR